MKTLRPAALALILPVLAQAQTPPASPTRIIPPRVLHDADRVPDPETSSPGSGVQGPDGKDLGVEESVQAPESDPMKLLTDPGFFENVKKTKNAEKTVGHPYWHSDMGLDYCHYRDMEGNNWYGWSDEGQIYWVLWRGNRYWWKDSMAGLWLYFDRGYWWRAEGQKNGQSQVYIEGEYYLCSKDGSILADEGQDGQGLINSGQGRFQGDSHGGHWGGHGGGQGQGTGGSNGAPSGGGQGQ